MANFRARLNLSSTSNRRYTDEVYFGGVDYANPRMSVQQGHAIDEMNYVYRDKSVQKRFGVLKGVTRKQRFHAIDVGGKYVLDTSERFYDNTDSTETSVPSRISGMWSYKDYIIVNRGGYLFYLEMNNGILEQGCYSLRPIAFGNYDYVTSSNGAGYLVYYSIDIGQWTSHAFEGNGKLYILSGTYLYVLEAVDDEYGHFKLYSLTEAGNPYVPTTTLGIVQNESEGYATRTTYESPNLLTPIRKNGFVGGIKNKEENTTTFTYTLDTKAKEIKNVHIKTAGFPYSMRSTACKASASDTNVLDGVDNLSYTGFAFPRMADNGIVDFVVNPNASGWKIDLRNFIVYGMNGERLVYSALDKTPPLEFQKGKSSGKIVPYVNEVGDMTISAVSTSVEGNNSGKTADDTAPYSEFSKYESGKYYVAIFGKSSASGVDDIYNPYKKIKYYYTNEDGDEIETTDKNKATKSVIPEGTVFKVSKGENGVYKYNDFKVKPIHQGSSNVTIGYDYCNYYQLVIFAKIDGEIRYASITFRFVKYNASKISLVGITDPHDYAGNIPVMFIGKNETYTSYPNLAILSMFGIDISDKMKDKGMLYDKAGSFLSKYAPDMLAYPYNEKEVTLVPKEPSEFDGGYVLYSKLNGVLKEVSYPFNNLKSNQTGFFLVDMNEQGNDDTAKIYGYVLMEDGVTDSIVLYENPQGEYDGQSNIECEFVAEGEENNKDDINHCTFGILYGTQNYRNRLFVSGNADNPNCDWHSADGTEEGDFDYFPASSVCKYGEATPLAGYGIVSDGKLMAVKRFSDREPSVYYRTATYAAKKDDYGKAVTDLASGGIYEESYPLTQTNSHIGALSSNLFTDFNGDSLFVDTDGRIVGMDNVGTTYDNQRVANSRTALIDPKLKMTPDSSRYLVSYGNDLFYFVDDIAYYCNYDNRYEWYPIDVPDSKVTKNNPTEKTTCSCMFDGKAYFGTDRGGIYRFNEGQFIDIDSIPLENGELVIDRDEENYPLVKCGNLVMSNNARATATLRGFNHFKYSGNYAIILGLVAESVAEGRMNDTDFMIRFEKGVIEPESKYYLNIKLVGFEYAQYSFELCDNIEDYDERYDTYYLKGLSSNFATELDEMLKYGYHVKVFRKIEEEDTIDFDTDGNAIVNASDGKTFSKFALSFDGGYISISTRTPVKASYITAPYLTGSLGNRKTIDSYTIISDKGYQNEVYVKAITNNVAFDELFSMGGQVDYSDLSYMRTDYTRYDLPHTQTLLGKFFGPFITLSINSPNAVNSVLTKINFLYHTAGKTYGKN